MTRFRALAVALALCAGPGLALPARAGVDVDFGAAVRLGDRTDVYFAISSRYFERDRSVVETVARRYSHPDDVAVALFISVRSGKSPDYLHALRRQGLSWWEISLRCGLGPDVWFVPVTRTPGPPYGKAYGHWKKHRANRAHRFVLADDDVRNLVAVRVMHEYYGVSVEAAMRLRSAGRDLRTLVYEEYDSRHGHKAAASRAKGAKNTAPASQSGRGQGKGRSGKR